MVQQLISHIATSSVSLNSLPQVGTGSNTIQIIINIVLGIVGAICLLMITISGFRYIVSGGEPQLVKQAKEGLLYSIVGLLIVIFAQVIVSFVVGKL